MYHLYWDTKMKGTNLANANWDIKQDFTEKLEFQ